MPGIGKLIRLRGGAEAEARAGRRGAGGTGVPGRAGEAAAGIGPGLVGQRVLPLPASARAAIRVT